MFAIPSFSQSNINTEINERSLIFFGQILNSDTNSIIQNWPIQDKSLIDQIEGLCKDNDSECENLKYYITQFFNGIKQSLLTQVDAICEQEIQKIDSIKNLTSQLQEKYNKFSQKESIKSILQDNSLSISNKQSNLNQIIQTTQILEPIHKLALGTLVQDIINLRNSSTSNQNLHWKFGNHSNENCLNQSHEFSETQQQQQQQLQQQQEQDSISVSTGNQQQQQQESKDTSVKLEQSIEQDEQISLNSNSISIESSDHFNTIVEDIFDKLEFNFQTNQQMFEDLTSPNGGTKSQLGIEFLLRLISENTNQSNTQFMKSLESIFKLIEPLFNAFYIQFPNSQILESCSINSSSNLSIQYNKPPQREPRYSELEVSDDSISSTKFRFLSNKTTTTPSSNGTSPIISREFEEYLMNKQQIEPIKKSNVNIPIFSLKQQSYCPLSKNQFVTSQFSSSSKIQIYQIMNIVDLVIPGPLTGQVVTQAPLKNSSSYVLRISFDQPYGRVETLENKGQFRIGFIKQSQIHTTRLLGNSANLGFCSLENKGAKILTKGQCLNSPSIKMSTDELEFRWCIEKQEFYISDCEYLNINKVNDSFIDPKEIYHFGIYAYLPILRTWRIQISHFSEIS